MKKIVKRVLLLLLVVLFIRFIFFLLKNEHSVEYVIKTSDYDFNIKEMYKKGIYYFKIESNNKTYSFYYNNEFFKRKETIKDIKYYSLDDMLCIFPILDNNKYYDILCYKDNLYSYSYYKDELSFFVKELQSAGYSNSSWNIDSSTKKLGNALIYQENISKDTYIYIWKYNGFYSLSNKKLSQINVFSSDTYINSLGIKVDKYYIIPNYDEKYDYNELLIFNMINNKKKTLKLKKGLTNDYYNNGVVSDKLYIFDVDHLKQYVINPKLNRYKEIGNEKNNGLYYNGEWSTINIYDFKNQKLAFIEDVSIPNEVITKEVYIYKNDYYYVEGNDVVVYNSILDTKTVLFSMKDIYSMKIIENDLYFIKDDTLYLYNDQCGLKKIVTYSELDFNKTNRYEVYKK